MSEDKPSAYFRFHCAIMGYRIIRADGREFAKFELWEKCRLQPEELAKIKARNHPLYSFIPKKKWVNGRLMEVSE